MMEQVQTWIKLTAAAIGGGLAWVFGAWDALLMVLLAFIILDYVSGVLGGVATRALSSEIGFRGLIKKIGIFVIIAVASLLDKVIPAANGALRSAACVFFIANEGLSIIENWARIGLPLPEAVRKALLQLKEKEEGR